MEYMIQMKWNASIRFDNVEDYIPSNNDHDNKIKKVKKFNRE